MKMSGTTKLSDITNTTTSQEMSSKPIESTVKPNQSVNLKNIFKGQLLSDENYIVKDEDMDQLEYSEQSMMSPAMGQIRLKTSPGLEQIGDNRKRRKYSPYTLKRTYSQTMICEKDVK